ncbi:MAG TPA: NHL repeat-containing protein, partial [Acidimicrobiales bacterium]|nr:NHL repeat-containing protein [Acidimicrobiales bacterium]
MKQRAVLLRFGLAVLVCAGALTAAAAELAVPNTAGATPVTSTAYVSNSNASTVTSYPTSASGNTSPIATLSSPSSVNSPEASAFDTSGDLWAANSANNTLVEFTPNQLSSSGSPAPNVTISGTGLDQPDALSFDSSGDLWVADHADSRIVEFTASQLATNGAPTPNVTLTATASSLDGPVGLAFDSSGDLWVTNFTNSTVVEFTASQLSTSGSPAPSVTLSPSASSLSEPVGLAFGTSGDLWVTNVGNSTVVEFTPTQLAATGSPTPNVVISSTGTSLDYPYSLAFDSLGDLWVGNFSNNTVVEFTTTQLTATGAPAPNVTISTNPGDSLDGPVGLIFASSGNLWAENYNGDTIVEFTASQLATNGSPNPDVTLFATTSLDQPHGLAFDSSGDLWVANYPDSTIIEFTPSEIATGSPTPNVTLTSTAGSLSGPLGLAFDSSGDLWVSNFDQNTVAEFTPAQLATSGSPTPNVTLSSTAGNSLDSPWGLAFDSSGDLWVANGDNSTLVEFTPTELATSGSPTPNVTLSATAGSLDDPVGLAFDASGDLWAGNASTST